MCFSFSDAEHKECLDEIGVSKQQFESLKDYSEEVDEDDLCVICMEGKCEAVFMDCGHMKTCMEW